MTGYRPLTLPFKDLVIYQDSSAQGVSLASQLLFDAATEEFGDQKMRVLELGSGCGIVSIMCALARPNWQITGIEIQEELVKLAQSNARLCEVEIDFLSQDIKKHEGSYDLILGNPPWRKADSGMMSENPARNLSRFEISCTLEDVVAAVKRCLTPGATGILLYPRERNQDLYTAAENTLLDIKKQEIHIAREPYFASFLEDRKER